jgi:hypothetical protein
LICSEILERGSELCCIHSPQPGLEELLDLPSLLRRAVCEILLFVNILRKVEQRDRLLVSNPFPVVYPGSLLSLALPTHFSARRRLRGSQCGHHVETVEHEVAGRA